MTGVLRPHTGSRQRVTFIELFFDLVYVFAVTQLSHLLLGHLTVHGALQMTLLLLAVWWAWMYTTWFSNWFHPDQRTVRLVLVGAMLASLIMSATLPRAFSEHGLAFAVSYTVLQVGRNAFAAFSQRRDANLRINLQRVLVWSLPAGALWIAGGLTHHGARELLWLSAVLVDYAAPALRYPTPGLGRSTVADWNIDGAHMAERCQLFVMIALGESILVTGATFGEEPFHPGSVASFVLAFALSVGLWWIYFDRGAEAATERLAAADVPGRLARSAYTYLHLLLVGGIIISAVGDELVITHPAGHSSLAMTLTVLGGPALYLAGHTLFKYAVFESLPVSRLVAIGVLVVLMALAFAHVLLPPLALVATAAVVIGAVALIWR
jgi:low temperature requirement protein LtrA